MLEILQRGMSHGIRLAAYIETPVFTENLFKVFFFLFEVKHAKTELKPEVTFYEFVCSGFSIV